MTERIEEAKQMAVRIAAIMDDKKASDIVVIEMPQELAITDYFVICTGANRRQLVAIAEDIRLTLAGEMEIRPMNISGKDTAQWVLMDYATVVVHVFDEPTRQFYDLELLWGDARKLDWREVTTG